MFYLDLSRALELESAFARGISRDVQGVRIALAAIEDLISLKEHTGRAQDQADVEHLRRIGRGYL